ncbi:hypothetical protein DFJ63DRAFT_311510 [Scheffersomyces coipomensis]|uniref:uncharacterized protein n=1 Tax=Scheffersomyces coipomensis TaxID=1788519 RepID=UPI00315CD40B
MDYDTIFLTKYFLSFTYDITIDIIRLLPNPLIECLLNTNAFDLVVYNEFLRHLIVCKNYERSSKFVIGAMLENSLESLTSFNYTDPDLTLHNWPQNFSPRTVHIYEDYEEVEFYLSFDHEFLKTVHDIRITVSMSLDELKKYGMFTKIIDFPNLTTLNIEFNCGIEWIKFPYNFNGKSDILEFKKFAERLGSPESMYDITERLPISIESLRVGNIIDYANLNYLMNLKSMSITCFTVKDLNNFPTSLEKLSLSSCTFNRLIEYINWPPNLKSLNIELSEMSSIRTSVNLVNWPKGLTNLTLNNNKFTSCNIGNLPQSLEYLEITSKSSYPINFNSEVPDGYCRTFPRSLKQLKLSSITFADSLYCDIEFPVKLEKLELKIGLKTLISYIFPPSLTDLDLSFNNITSLETYNCNSKDWKQLVNLKHLNLMGNPLNVSGIKNWLPPTNLKHLNLSCTHITSLEMELFNESNKNYTNSLTKIDVSHTYIVRVPPDFYLPDNVYQFDISESHLNYNFLPVLLGSKKFIRAVFPILPLNNFHRIFYNT